MAKWTFMTPVNGGDLLPNVTETRVLQVTVDFLRNEVNAIVAHGSEVDGRFRQSPVNPPGAEQIVGNLDQYQDLQTAWNNFERKLFQRMAADGKLPSGSEA